LNQQIVNLQNNPPLQIQHGMAGYAPKRFKEISGEDPETWIKDFRQWCEAAGLDPGAGNRHHIRIHGVFETCL